MSNVVLILFMMLAPFVDTQNIKLGETSFQFTHTVYGKEKQNIVFINLHKNENISVDQSKEVLYSLQKYSIVEVVNPNGRNVKFKYKNKDYEIDPNRIFSVEGIKKSLEDRNGKIDSSLLQELTEVVEKFAKEYTSKYIDGKKLVIALHNNTPSKNKNDGFSIYSYAKGGEEYELGNTDKSIANNPNINPKQNIDDFFLTNRKEYFDALVEKGYNVVFQSKNPKDDGSLSVFAEKNNIPYINIEAQQVKDENIGHKEIQKKMIFEATKLIQ